MTLPRLALLLALLLATGPRPPTAGVPQEPPGDAVPTSARPCAQHTGRCRRFCFAHETQRGHFGCPRRYR